MREKQEPATKADASVKKEKAATCGLVMPISALDNCGPEHWLDVKNIIAEAVESVLDPKFTVRLVSDADEVGIIQKRIVQNLYTSDVVICDVSGKNPNVMFELGLRLAFDKPTVIIKDDKTEYSFDTSVIEHVGYPRDLRFSKIVAFKAHLAEKVSASYRKAKQDPDASTFLKSFGKFHVATLNEDAIPADRLVIEMLTDLQSEVSMLRRRVGSGTNRAATVQELSIQVVDEIAEKISRFREENAISGPSGSLVGNDALYEFLEREVDAPRKFVTKKSFIEAIDYVLKTRNIV